MGRGLDIRLALVGERAVQHLPQGLIIACRGICPTRQRPQQAPKATACGSTATGSAQQAAEQIAKPTLRRAAGLASSAAAHQAAKQITQAALCACGLPGTAAAKHSTQQIAQTTRSLTTRGLVLRRILRGLAARELIQQTAQAACARARLCGPTAKHSAQQITKTALRGLVGCAAKQAAPCPARAVGVAFGKRRDALCDCDAKGDFCESSYE